MERVKVVLNIHPVLITFSLFCQFDDPYVAGGVAKSLSGGV